MIKNKQTLFIIFAVILFAVFLGGCKSKTIDGEGAIQLQDNQEQSGENLDYPRLYKSYQLPEYPNVKLDDIGRQTTSVKDGFKLQLTSTDSVQTIVKYYEEEMKKLDWDVPGQKFPNDQIYNNRFTKDDLYYQMTITQFPEGETKITINFAQN